MSETRVKQHPTLGILVCTDGHIYVPANKACKAHWTYGWKFNNGYLGVRLNKQNYLVHRLIAETFLPNPLNKPTVDHIDRNKNNNSLNNLRWATIQEQNENHPGVINRKNYGVRRKDNTKLYAINYQKEYSKLHKKEILDKAKQYYYKNREQVIQKQKDYVAKKQALGFKRIRMPNGKSRWVKCENLRTT